MIQSGKAIFLFSIAFGIFILIQIMNGIVNILAAINMKKHALLQAQMKEREYVAMQAHREDIIFKFEEIMDELVNTRDQRDELSLRIFRMEEYLNEICGFLTPPEEKKVRAKPRGPYGPRKRKAIEHKENSVE
jgi:hypothetical protein